MRYLRHKLGLWFLKPWLYHDALIAHIKVEDHIEPQDYWMGRLSAVERLKNRRYNSRFDSLPRPKRRKLIPADPSEMEQWRP